MLGKCQQFGQACVSTIGTFKYVKSMIVLADMQLCKRHIKILKFLLYHQKTPQNLYISFCCFWLKLASLTVVCPCKMLTYNTEICSFSKWRKSFDSGNHWKRLVVSNKPCKIISVILQICLSIYDYWASE